MKYKVGDKFVVEILGVDSNLSAPYETALSRFTECQLRCIPQLVNGVDMDSYNKGAEDAWELMKLINANYDKGGLKLTELQEVFGTHNINNIFVENTYQEAKAKFEAWEKAEEEIKVGDTVYANKNRDFNAIVLGVNSDLCHLLWPDGSCGIWNKSDLTKTGENYADKVGDIINCIKNE